MNVVVEIDAWNSHCHYVTEHNAGNVQSPWIAPAITMRPVLGGSCVRSAYVPYIAVLISGAKETTILCPAILAKMWTCATIATDKCIRSVP